MDEPAIVLEHYKKIEFRGLGIDGQQNITQDVFAIQVLDVCGAVLEATSLQYSVLDYRVRCERTGCALVAHSIVWESLPDLTSVVTKLLNTSSTQIQAA
jgi:hypothetical protein